MFINKIGQYHLDYGINNQDYGFEGISADSRKVKCVLDGCSEGKHSEVGVKLYARSLESMAHQLRSFGNIEDYNYLYCNMWQLLNKSGVMGDKGRGRFDQVGVVGDIDFMLQYCCFTILCCVEQKDQFRVDYVGDGFIIRQKHDDTIEFEKLKDEGEGNEYLVYNFIDSKYLDDYKDGVETKHLYFSKEEYKNVGVATDGIRYILENTLLKQEFEQLLVKGKEVPIKLFINRNQKKFQDDITIAF